MQYIEGVDIVMRENGFTLREAHKNANGDAFMYCYRNSKNKWLVMHTFCYDLDVSQEWLEKYRAEFHHYKPMDAANKDLMVYAFND